MPAGMVFRADAELTAPSALDARTLKADLDAIRLTGLQRRVGRYCPAVTPMDT